MNQQEFLDEIENEMDHIVDGYYASVVPEIIQKIENYLDSHTVTWHPVQRLPTPMIPLRLRLESGEVITGSRPSYIASYSEHDLGYRDSSGQTLFNVVEWTIA